MEKEIKLSNFGVQIVSSFSSEHHLICISMIELNYIKFFAIR